MNIVYFIALVITFYKCNVYCSLFRNWNSVAKSTFKSGKDTYKSLLNKIKEKEEDCISLVSIDKHISSEVPVDLDYIKNSKDPYPCLTQITKNGFEFDINLDSDIHSELNYSKIINEAGCWKFVINEINSLDVESCDFNGDASRSLIALAKTKCHFLRANRKFPTRKEGCVLNPSVLTNEEINELTMSGTNDDTGGDDEASRGWDYNPCLVSYKGSDCEKIKRKIVSHCTSVMSESAFQMYHSDLNHIDNICFYLQSGEWNKRTEMNINKLTDSANNMVKVYKSVRDQFQLLNEQQSEQLNKAENLTIWIDSIKSDLGTVLTVITAVKDYQRKILDFINNFKTFFTYFLFVILGIVVTSFEFTSNSRFKVILAIVTSCILETLLNKLFNQWLDIDVNKYISPEGQQYILRTLRISMGVYIALEWLYSFIWYKPAWKVMLTEVNELKKVIENPVIYIPNNSIKNFEEVRYTLDDFVEKFDGDDSEYTYESDVSSSEYDSEELGSDSEGIVEEYLESVNDESCE